MIQRFDLGCQREKAVLCRLSTKNFEKKFLFRIFSPTFRLREIFRKLPIDFLRQGLTIPLVSGTKWPAFASFWHQKSASRKRKRPYNAIKPVSPFARNGHGRQPGNELLLAMMQIGVEMAAPVGPGLLARQCMLGLFPWLTAVGAVLGLMLGLVEITRVGSGKDKANPAQTMLTRSACR